jgi:hypothetical protein
MLGIVCMIGVQRMAELCWARRGRCAGSDTPGRVILQKNNAYMNSKLRKSNKTPVNYVDTPL